MTTIQLHKKSDGSVIDIDPTTIAAVRAIPGTPAVPEVAAIPATPDYSIVVLAGGLAAQSFVEVTETAAEVTAMLPGATGATGSATPPRGRG
jgi:acyl-CoA synthetase (NDP forming)